MSLDKAIEHGKEKRKPYRGSKAFISTTMRDLLAGALSALKQALSMIAWQRRQETWE